MKCGHCKQTDVTVEHVRACAGLPAVATSQPTVDRPATGTTTTDPWAQRSTGPTDKQRNFLNNLLTERDHDLDEASVTQARTSKKDCSRLIEYLLGFPKKPKTEDNPKGGLEDGIYRKDGVLYRVYHTVHGANRQVASVINLVDKDTAHADKFTYVGKKPLHDLTAADMLPFDEACRIASAYEWCIACGTILHNDKSVELGIGPVCRKKFR